MLHADCKLKTGPYDFRKGNDKQANNLKLIHQLLTTLLDTKIQKMLTEMFSFPMQKMKTRETVVDTLHNK
jgi:hypothetical protein